MKMRSFGIVAVAVLFAFVLAGVAGAAPGIRNSAHDLSNTSTAALKNQSAANNQICIYCHTPHRAMSTQLLWNHTNTAAASFNWGNDLDGNALTKTTHGTALSTTLRSASKRCLACHDGTVALGDLSNAGSGSAGVLSGLANIVGQTDANGKLINAGYLMGVAGAIGGNHPVSIPYPGQTYNGLTSGATADGSLGNFYAVKSTGCLTPSGLCTTAPGTDGRDGTKVQLLPNSPGGNTNMGVECTSCHEPHNVTGLTYMLLIDNNSASGLCRSCHNK